MTAATRDRSVAVIIPAWNEEPSIGKVIANLPREYVRHIIVADNNSTDGTASAARAAGAVVVSARRQGYGSACLAGMEYLSRLPVNDRPGIVVFIDGDYSDHPEQLPLLIQPILDDQADFVVGSRMLKPQARSALLPQAVFGNRLACFLIRVLFGHSFSDLGPFRAIRWEALQGLAMRDPNFGWTVEMQVKAVRRRLRIREVAVDYRPRIGKSKISGAIGGSFRAGGKILWTIWRQWVA